jgi:CubicO group peptidase (beta-lactamase class C family)
MKVFPFICALLCLFFYSDNIFANTKIETITPELEQFIERALKEWEAPGLAIAIVKDGKIVYEKGFGTLSVDSSEPITTDTVFQIASLTKTFLATLIGQLVDEGKLNFDDPVRKFLPDFFLISEDVSAKFTIRDLISHRSGLPAFSGDTFIHLGFSQEQIIKAMGKIPPKYPMRSHYGYQNQLFGIAGLIVEKVTGKSINTLFREYIFMPLDMRNTSAGLEGIVEKDWIKSTFNLLNGSKTPSVAKPHHILGGKTYVMPFNPEVYTFTGSTGVNATIHDMAQWVMFQLNRGKVNGKPLISEKSFAALREPQIEVYTKSDQLQFPQERIRNIHYCMGWFTYEYGEGDHAVQVESHMGGLSGTRGLMVILPKENMGFVILSNFGSMTVSMLPEAIRDKFLGLYLGLKDQNWSTRNLDIMKDIRKKNADFKLQQKLTQPSPPQNLSFYEGVYESTVYGRVTIARVGQKLMLQYGEKKIPLSHWNRDEFSFLSNQLSPHYGDTNPGYIEFGGNSAKKAMLCAITVLYEGDGLFKRVG